jgi:hypothetical protein
LLVLRADALQEKRPLLRRDFIARVRWPDRRPRLGHQSGPTPGAEVLMPWPNGGELGERTEAIFSILQVDDGGVISTGSLDCLSVDDA